MARVELTGASPAKIEAGLLAVAVFEEDLAKRTAGVALALDHALAGHLSRAAKEERFRGKADQSLLLHTMGRLPATRLMLLGLGSRAGAGAIAGAGFEPLRMAAGKSARTAVKAGASRLAIALPEELAPAGAARAAVEGALLGAYRFDRYRSEERDEPRLREVALALPGGAARDGEVKRAVRLGEGIAGAVSWARDLVNEAPMHCTPSRLARAAQQLAREAGLACQVRGPREIAALGMGMFLGVTRGSAEEPRLVKVSWLPRGKRARPLVLVGKAITFDSGGLSLKPTESMVTMNGDMAGSAAVLAAMKLVAELEPAFPVHALLGACENMPGGRAYKPSDVLEAYNGKTVEVTNTDAE
jgi:leucyl aminopeptidase